MKSFLCLFLYCVAAIAKPTGDDVPESFDWRKEGAILSSPETGVLCGSADWAFSIATAVESQLFLANGTLEPISPQYVIDCCSFSDGCNVSPSLVSAYTCLARNGGVNSNYAYFNGIQGKCLGGANLPITYASWNGGVSEIDMKEMLVKLGPLSVTIYANDLRSYSGGVWEGSNCFGGDIAQRWSLLLVGYGSEDGVDYWILKNWWGTSWGEHGYFRLVRNKNACGITTTIFVPFLPSY